MITIKLFRIMENNNNNNNSFKNNNYDKSNKIYYRIIVKQ